MPYESAKMLHEDWSKLVHEHFIKIGRNVIDTKRDARIYGLKTFP